MTEKSQNWICVKDDNQISHPDESGIRNDKSRIIVATSTELFII